MTTNLRWILAITAIIAPTLHTLSDLLEWSNSGFSQIQLLINYAGFLPIPFLMLGLYAMQRPYIGWPGLLGSVLYGVAFIYFIHTTLFALERSVPNYEFLLEKLGGAYTLHGGLMVIGGLRFGLASLQARVLARGAVSLFVIGIWLNFGIAFLPLPDIFQILGSLVRNVGLIAIGIAMMRLPIGSR